MRVLFGIVQCGECFCTTKTLSDLFLVRKIMIFSKRSGFFREPSSYVDWVSDLFVGDAPAAAPGGHRSASRRAQEIRRNFTSKVLNRNSIIFFETLRSI